MQLIRVSAKETDGGLELYNISHNFIIPRSIHPSPSPPPRFSNWPSFIPFIGVLLFLLSCGNCLLEEWVIDKNSNIDFPIKRCHCHSSASSSFIVLGYEHSLAALMCHHRGHSEHSKEAENPSAVHVGSLLPTRGRSLWLSSLSLPLLSTTHRQEPEFLRLYRWGSHSWDKSEIITVIITVI